MLRKKQYIRTLLAGSIIFFVIFVATYLYTSQNGIITSYDYREKEVPTQSKLPISVQMEEQIERIQLDTKITLLIRDELKGIIETLPIESTSLMGMSRMDIESLFKDYTVTAFNEDEVRLEKKLETLEEIQETVAVSAVKEPYYVLGVQNDYICIKSTDGSQKVITIDRKATDLSRKMYSLLLKEQIKISELQKETLLHNAGEVQKILQDYAIE